MRVVVVGVPTHDGRVTVQFAHAMVETVMLAAGHMIQIMPIYLAYESLLERARNQIVSMTLASSASDLVFIDADEAWDPAAFLRLLSHPVDVVGLPVVRKTDEGLAFNIRADLPMAVDEKTGLIPVISVGTGFLRVTRRALEAVAKACGTYRDDDGREWRHVFKTAVIDGRYHSEDVMFCKSLGVLGFQTWVDPTATVAHTGVKTWAGDFLQWAQAADAFAPKAAPAEIVAGA